MGSAARATEEIDRVDKLKVATNGAPPVARNDPEHDSLEATTSSLNTWCNRPAAQIRPWRTSSTSLTAPTSPATAERRGPTTRRRKTWCDRAHCPCHPREANQLQTSVLVDLTSHAEPPRYYRLHSDGPSSIGSTTHKVIHRSPITGNGREKDPNVDNER